MFGHLATAEEFLLTRQERTALRGPEGAPASHTLKEATRNGPLEDERGRHSNCLSPPAWEPPSTPTMGSMGIF